MTEKQIVIKGLNVNYKIFGEGKPFLILHGWPSSSDRWVEVGESLGKEFLVIVPDLPGFGRSEEPQKAWSLDDYVDFVKEFSEKLPVLQNSFYLLGHSFGGAIASKFAIKYNQKVDKLFLVSAACVRSNTIFKKILVKIAKMVKMFSFVPYYMQFRKIIYKFIIRKSDYIYQKDGIMKETYLNILDDLSYCLSFIKVPTIIIWGDKDSITLIKEAYYINKKIEKSKLIIINNGGHDLQIKMGEMLTGKIL